MPTKTERGRDTLENILPEGEKLVESTRQHVISMAGGWLRGGLMVMLGVLLLWVAGRHPGWLPASLWAEIAVYLPWVGAIVFVLGLLTWTGTWIGWWARYYAVTAPEEAGRSSGTLIQTWGYIPQRISTTSLDKVNEFSLAKSALGVVFGYSTIVVLTGNDIIQRLNYVPNARGFYKACVGLHNQVSRNRTGVIAHTQ